MSHTTDNAIMDAALEIASEAVHDHVIIEGENFTEQIVLRQLDLLGEYMAGEHGTRIYLFVKLADNRLIRIYSNEDFKKYWSYAYTRWYASRYSDADWTQLTLEDEDYYRGEGDWNKVLECTDKVEWIGDATLRSAQGSTMVFLRAVGKIIG